MKFRLDTWPALAAGLILVIGVTLVSAGNPPPPPPGGGPGPGPGGPGPGPAPDTSKWTDAMVANSALSASVSSGTADNTYAPYYTPFSFATILQDSYALPVLTQANSIMTRSRYLLSPAAGSYLAIGAPSTSAATTFAATSAPTKYGEILSQTVQAVGEPAGGFRFDSELHGLYSLDVSADGSLVFQNNWGTAAAPTNRGYVVFSYDSGTRFLRAQARYSYDLRNYGHSKDSAFAKAGYYVQVNGANATLVASSSSATAITLYNAPINVDIPGNFNPDSILYQPNDRVDIGRYIRNGTADMEGERGHVLQDMARGDTQVATVGDDKGTESAAAAQLTVIANTLKAEGASMRYPANVYMAFRKGLLNTYLNSDDIANGTLGMRAVPYVFFTNAADGKGVHHPFMVIAAYSITDKPNRLIDVRRPPGDGGPGGYSEQKVTRDATLQLYLYKIPLKDYGNVSALTDNTLPATLKSDAASPSPNSAYNYASISGVGVAVDGTAIYPVLNNTLFPAQNNAELTSIGDHVGQGMGLHYHADGHVAMNNDLQLYNMNDYKNREHPPLIGFGLDGVALYGVYESQYSSMEGSNVPLDAFGGHSHGAYGYHYHSHMVNAMTPNGAKYTLDVLLKGAWKGKINAIPEFWEQRNEPAYALSQRSRWVGKMN